MGVGNARASYQYFNLLHRYALGNYRELIKKITIDPAMLFYLNGVSNSKYAPDENYARELQELFTVGKGPGSQYTEQDVLNAARVLTGWTIDWDDLEREGELRSYFNSDIHDIDDKEFSSFYGGRVIKGGYGLDGEKETDELLDMIFETNEIARYLSRRLYQFFVFPEIDDVAEEMIITPMAEVIRSSGYELRPALDLLLRSDHFYDTENIGVMIKSPVDFLVGTFKSMAHSNTASGLNGAHQYHQSILWTMSDYGMEIGDPPSVSGWSPYYQSPGFDRLWITTDTIQKRARTIDTILYWGFWINEDHHPQFDLLSFVGTFDHPENPDVLIEDLSAFLLATSLPDINREELRSVLLNGQTNAYYWTQAWEDYRNNPTQTNETTVLNRLRPMFQIMFQLSEYQLM